MGVKITNNAFSTLASELAIGGLSLTVQTGHGVRFPTASIASGDYFFLTLSKTNGDMEVVKVTNRSTDTFTIVRAQDSISGVTAAKAFAINDRVELRPVAAMLNALPNRALVTADYTDASVTTVKLASSGVTAGTYGGLGKDLAMSVNSKGQVTSISETSGLIQTNTYSYTTAGATQTWTKPDAGSLIRVQLWGAGGGGARGAEGYGYGGGGGGGYFELWLRFAELSSTASIVIGGGGAGAVSEGVAGANGSNSTFVSGGIAVTAYGGAGGQNNQNGGGGAGTYTAANLSAGGRMGGGTGAYIGDTNVAATDATMPWGGGGGGLGVNTGAVSECNGGYAIWGGGGGGGGFNGASASIGGGGAFGGSGGNGGTGTTPGSAGATPAGGGGGSEVANAGNGGNGRCIITVF